MNELYVISIVTGDTFKIQEDDVPTLYKYQIPLKKKPHHSCNRCHGRGWTGIDPQNGLHHLCKCVDKCFMDGYKISEMTIEMPRLSK